MCERERERERDLALQATTTKTHCYHSNWLGNFTLMYNWPGLSEYLPSASPEVPDLDVHHRKHTERPPPPNKEGVWSGAADETSANSCSLTSAQPKTQLAERDNRLKGDDSVTHCGGRKGRPEHSHQGLPALVGHRRWMVYRAGKSSQEEA
ncbi:hypothetical protein AMECASPLE_008452 [Ameca splendens]|uniref:Uncharacterized protein n=1 Tax=Ameca splendens TaxID=208324 RepID=A0ABV0ZLR0_9TELE